MEMKDDSLIMKIMFKAVAATIARGFGGKKDYENPEFRMLMNSSAGRMHPRCSAEVRMAKALLYFFRDRAAMKQSGRRTAGAAVRLGCIFRRKNRRIAYRASKEAGEINENHFSWNRRADTDRFTVSRDIRRCTVTLLGEDIGMWAGTVFHAQTHLAEKPQNGRAYSFLLEGHCTFPDHAV